MGSSWHNRHTRKHNPRISGQSTQKNGLSGHLPAAVSPGLPAKCLPSGLRSPVLPAIIGGRPPWLLDYVAATPEDARSAGHMFIAMSAGLVAAQTNHSHQPGGCFMESTYVSAGYVPPAEMIDAWLRLVDNRERWPADGYYTKKNGDHRRNEGHRIVSSMKTTVEKLQHRPG